MDEKGILKLLQRISQHLGKAETHIKDNDWNGVGEVLSRVDGFQVEIKNNTPSVEVLLSQNPQFKEEYEPLKESVLEKTNQIISAIEEWKITHTEKITGSKNVLDNISKYYKPADISYYIDREE
jgi:hypothetical protein